MIVVDGSVWIGHLRDIDSEPVRALRSMLDLDQISVGDLVLLEVLQGTRAEQEAARVEAALRRFRIVTMLDDRLASQGAAHYRALRRRGITIRKACDVIIATYCIAERHRLRHDDRDFEPFVAYCGLLPALGSS